LKFPILLVESQDEEFDWLYGTNATMKVFAVFVLAFIALALSQTRPSINDNFSAKVELIEEQGTHKVKFNVCGFRFLINTM
jgi:hypothetical protein